MFGTIRRHQTWLWVVIVAITVLTFVVFFSPNQKFGRGGATAGGLGSISGTPVSMQDYLQAQAEMSIHYFLSHGEWPDKDTSAKQMGFDLERETYFRIFFIQKFKEYGIHISEQSIGEQAAQILRSMGRNGTPVALEKFETEFLLPRGYTIADFRRFLEHQNALRELVGIIGMSGRTVSKGEAQSLFELEQQQIATEAVFYSPSNYLSTVTVMPEMVAQFFTNQMARYRVPERVQVSYVKFNITNFFAEADGQIAKLTNFEQNVEAVYQQRGTNYYKGAKTAEEAKARIKDEARRDLALRSARNKAAALAEKLGPSTSLESLAHAAGMDLATTAPFTAQRGPREFEAPTGFAQAAFRLTSDEPYGGPIIGQDGAYMIALLKRLPSEVPSLESVKDQVRADLQYMQAAMLAQSAGTNLAHQVSVGLKAGKTFAAICAEARVAPIKIPAFSLSTSSLPEVENRISLGRLQDVAFGIAAGNASGFVPTEDGGGLVLHVISRTAGDGARLQADFPAFLSQVRQTRQGEAFNAWFGREAGAALRDTPIARAQQRP